MNRGIRVLDRTVLVVDDDPLVLKTLKRTLVGGGYPVTTANSGEEALDRLRSQSVAVVLLDVMLPGVDGIETCRRIREDESIARVPVIFVTSAGEKELRIEGKRAGGDDFLVKPVDETELIARVENLVILHSYYRRLERERASMKKELDEQSDIVGRAMVEISRMSEHLHGFHEEMVYRLSKAVEFRDDETGNHVQRMSRYSELIARGLGMDGDRCDAIRVASALHDVGKIAIPDAILRKPGRLTDEEMDQMRKHAETGYNLLSGSKSHLIELAGTIAYTHHEKFDGNGYPRKLSGEDIPIEGRITAVADVFDALTSKRVYKPAFPIEKALAIFEEERGAHFDPAVLDSFVGALDDIAHIMTVYADV